MKKQMHKILLTSAIATFMLGGSALAADLVPGVTVTEDASSPTGYTATFVYEDAKAEQVNLVGTFGFYEEGKEVGKLPEETIHAKDYQPGMFRASSSDFAVTEEMTKAEGTDYWTVSLPLPSGHYLYNYNIDSAEENTPDPANQPMASTAKSGSASRLSTFNVPYDECQGSSIDFSFMMPRSDEQAGEVIYADYTDVNGNLAGLGIYLPYGYDENRTEGYKTIYLSHGAGGNEMEWFASGNTNYVFDNMIAEGTVEPTIVVTMNNTVYSWDFDLINQNVMDHIIPFMEENYNVGTSPEDRAFAGLSMGGMTTSNVLYENGDQFGYFGIFSGADGSMRIATLDQEKLKQPSIMIGAGIYDFGIDPSMNGFAVQHTFTQLSDLGIPYSYYIVKGGHDWTVWPQLIKIFAENYLWK